MRAQLKTFSGDKPLTKEEKVNANETFFTTIIGPSTLKTITEKPKWYQFGKKPVEKEVTIPGELWYNFLFPNTSFQIIHYDDNTLEVEVLGIKYPIQDSHVGAEDVLVMIDVTDEPFITRAGQTVSLGYHTLRYTMNFATILSKNKFRCKVDDFQVKVGVPQR